MIKQEHKNILKSLILILFIISIIFFIWYHKNYFHIHKFQTWLQGFGWLSPIIFILLYIIGVIFVLPATPLTMVGGFLFGLGWGTFYNLTAATLGATAAFLIGRYAGSGWLRNKISRSRLKKFLTASERQGWKLVAIVRLIPIIPFNLVNYALGIITKISLSEYFLATYTFMIPECFAYTYVGTVVDAALRNEMELFITRLFGAIGLLTILAILPWIMKKFFKF